MPATRSSMAGTPSVLGLTSREWSALSATVSKKIETGIAKLMKEHDEKVKKASKETTDTSSVLKTRLTESENAFKSVESQLKSANSSLSQLQNSFKVLESEAEELRSQRDSAVNERGVLQNAIDVQTNEINNLKSEITELSRQLKEAVDDKFKALSKNDEIQSVSSMLIEKEKRLNQEKKLLSGQIQNFTEDINKYSKEIHDLRSHYGGKIAELERQLKEKEDKLDVATSNVDRLMETNRELLREKNGLSERLLTYSQVENDALDNFKKELDAKTRLADMYMTMLNESNARLKEYEEKLNESQSSGSFLVSETSNLLEENKKIKSEYQTYKSETETLVSNMKAELEKANVRLKATREESLTLLLEDMSPSASATCNLIKTMSLTQIYDQIVKLTDQLSETRNENTKLTQKVNILNENIEGYKAKLGEQISKNAQVMEENMSLKKQHNEISKKRVQVENEKSDLVNQSEQIKSENAQLKNEIKDLSRQICFLLDRIQNQSETDLNSSFISKALVTFKDIEELQSNNVSLLRLVEELKDKLRRSSGISRSEEDKKMIIDLNKRIADSMDTQNHQMKIIEAVTSQRDRFEKQCLQLLEQLKNSAKSQVVTEEISVPPALIDKMSDSQISELRKSLEKQKEDYKKYQEEMSINENILSKQIDDLKKKLTALSMEQAKTISESRTNFSMYEALKKNIETYKKQITCLEDRNKIYDSSIMKQEETIRYLRNEAMTSLSKLKKYEVTLENMKEECKFLKESENRLKSERDLLKKERYSQSLIMNDIKLITVTDQRLVGDEKANLELKLNNATKELVEVKKQLKLQEDKFNEAKCNLERQLNQSETFLKEAKGVIENKKSQIVSLNEQLLAKSNMIEDLNVRVSNLISVSSLDDVPGSSQKVKELECQLANVQTQVTALNQQVLESKDYGKNYFDKYTELNSNYEALKKTHSDVKASLEAKIKELTEAENNLKEEINHLKAKDSPKLLQTHEVNKLSMEQLKAELLKTSGALNSLSKDLETKNDELKDIRERNEKLKKATQEAEEKFRHEMVLHSSDIQALSSLKMEYKEIKLENTNMKNTQSILVNEINELKRDLNEREKQYRKEYQDLKLLLDDVQSQNVTLHDQLQNFNNQCNISRASNVSTDADQPLDQSFGNSLFNTVNQLRKENNLLSTRFETANAEKDRLNSELEILKRKLNDMKKSLDDQANKAQLKQYNDNKASNVLTDTDKYNALADSNIHLRKDRDSLAKQVSHLSESNKTYEIMIKNLQSTGEDLKSKFDLMKTENAAMKTELVQCRNKLKFFSERTNKQTPEDWKRLQNERETLAKMLTNEKEASKKLLDEIALLRTAKSDIEEQIESFNAKFASLTDEFNRQSNELTITQTKLTKTDEELNITKTSLTEKITENNKIKEDLTSKENTLEQITKREIQIRNIANKYKTQYNELIKARDQKPASDATDASKSEADERALNELRQQNASFVEKCEGLEKELSSLREDLNNFDRVKTELVESKTSIVQLSEANAKLSHDLAELRAGIDNCEKNKTAVETQLVELRTKYDEQIAKSEHSIAAQKQTKNTEIAELNRRIEYLLNKINQMQKSVSNTQSPKPSTSQENLANNENMMETQFVSVSSDISSSASCSRNVVENFPISSSTTHHKISQLPPESTQGDTESENTPKDSSPQNPSVATLEGASEKLRSLQAASSSSSNNSNSTVTTSHLNENIEMSQRTNKRSRLSADQTDEQATTKRTKIQTPMESELDYQVPTSSQRDQEDDCVILLDSGDEDNQCENSYQASEDEEEKVAQSDDPRTDETQDKITPVVSVENNEVDVIDDQSPPENPQLQREDNNSGNSNEANTDQRSPTVSQNTEQQIETISSVTEGGNGYLSLGGGVDSAGVSGAYDEGSDSIVPSTPVLHLPRRSDGFGEAISSPATESTSREGCFTFAESRTESGDVAIEDTLPDLASQIAPRVPSISGDATPKDEEIEALESSEAEAEDSSQQNDEPSTVSSLNVDPLLVEESSEAEASSSDNLRGNYRRGQGTRQQPFNTRTSDYQLRQSPQRGRYQRANRRTYRR